MKRQELCEQLEQTTYFVHVYEKNGEKELELISGGSAVALTPSFVLQHLREKQVVFTTT
jgi:hypothetical protein